MNKHIKGIIWLIVFVLLTAGCSQTSNFGHSIQEFFGFSRPTATPVPATSEQQVQNLPQIETDPFGTGSANTGGGTSMANLGWDDLDPALIEPDPSDTESKGSEKDNWEDDPYAYSFSGSSFYDESAEIQGKQGNADFSVPGFGDPALQSFVPQPNNQPPANFTDPDRKPNRPAPNTPPNQLTFYPIRENPVFRPMCELPRTGFPTGLPTGTKESVSYAKTNMSISIPTLNVEENIVIVPLVDDNFPVEGLGENIGLLEGSGPGKEDLFVLAAHNHLNTQVQGPFAKLSAMKESDLIFISGANNSSRTFVVYANEKFASDDIDSLAAYVKPGCMILITCEDESVEGGYLNRRVVFAEAKED